MRATLVRRTPELFVLHAPAAPGARPGGLTTAAVAQRCRAIACTALRECRPILRRHGLVIGPELRQAFIEASYAQEQRVARQLLRRVSAAAS